jgi:hypothetical protein
MRLPCKVSVAERELVADRCRDVEASMRGMDNKPRCKFAKMPMIKPLPAGEEAYAD